MSRHCTGRLQEVVLSFIEVAKVLRIFTGPFSNRCIKEEQAAGLATGAGMLR